MCSRRLKPLPVGRLNRPASRPEPQRALHPALPESLIEAGQYAEATRLLDQLMAAPQDAFFMPRRGSAHWRSIKDEAARLIAALPPEGRAAYRLRVETRARQMLDQAAGAGRMDVVRTVADRYFHTSPGAEAMLLLAWDRLEQGQPFPAALYLERLKRESADAPRFEPTLSLLLAVCWYRAGLLARAERALAELPQDVRELQVAGRLQEAFDRGQSARWWLESLLGPAPAHSSGPQWRMYGGDSTRNGWASFSGAYLSGPLVSPLSDHAELAEVQRAIEKSLHEQFRLAVPALHPVVSGGRAVFRTATGLKAMELDSGRVVWEALSEDPLQHLLRDPAAQELPWSAPEFRAALRTRFLQNRAFGGLSTDGRRVFAVEDLPLGHPVESRRIALTPAGRPRLAPGQTKRYNLLAAYDLETGKLLWELNGSPETSQPAAEPVWFLGPPLPLGRRLYVLARVETQTRLFELEAASGRVISSLVLAMDQSSDEKTRFSPLGNLAAQSPDERLLAGYRPSFADGVLVCPTLDEHVVALDLAARKILWVHRLPSSEQSLRKRMIRIVQTRFNGVSDREPPPEWIDHSLVIAQGRVLVPAPETEELVCFDLHDGRQQWSVERDDGLYVGGVWNDRVVVVGRGSVWAVHLADGSFIWPHQRVSLPEGALPSGRGLLAPPRFYLPLSTAELLAIDLVEGRLAARSRSPEGLVPGNLVAADQLVLSQSLTGLRRLEDLEARARRLGLSDAAAQASGSGGAADEQLLIDRGELLLCQGKPAEALRLLAKAAQGKPARSRAARLLIAAIMDGLEVDFEQFAERAASWTNLVEPGSTRAELLRRLAEGYQRTGRHERAFESYLKLLDTQSGPWKLDHVEAARQVRTDCRLAARLEEIYREAGQAQRAELDGLIRRRMQNRLQSEQAAREALALFSWHPLGADLRLKLAEVSVRRGRALEAEQLLRGVLQMGSEPKRRFAAAGLAELLASAGRHQAAAGRAAGQRRKAPGRRTFLSLAGREVSGNGSGRRTHRARAGRGPAAG